MELKPCPRLEALVLDELDAGPETSCFRAWVVVRPEDADKASQWFHVVESLSLGHDDVTLLGYHTGPAEKSYDPIAAAASFETHMGSGNLVLGFDVERVVPPGPSPIEEARAAFAEILGALQKAGLFRSSEPEPEDLS